MVFNIFGADKIEQFGIKAGEEIIVNFDIDAHEYNGRWFNNIRAWNIQRVDAAAAQAGAPVSAAAPSSQKVAVRLLSLLPTRVRQLTIYHSK